MIGFFTDSLHYFTKGNQFYDSKQFGLASILYARTLERTFDEKTYHNWGNIHYMKGDYHKAIKKYTKATIISPVFSMSYNGWGSCLSRLGKYDEAIEKFRKSVEINDYFLAYLNWSLVLFLQKKEVEAGEVFEKGLKNTSMRELMLEKIYKFELSLIEERLAEVGNEEEKKFLQGRIAGYNWILEMIRKAFKGNSTEGNFRDEEANAIVVENVREEDEEDLLW